MYEIRKYSPNCGLQERSADEEEEAVKVSDICKFFVVVLRSPEHRGANCQSPP